MLNIKMDKTIKEEAQKTAKALGLPLSVIVNRYLKEFIHERRVEFSESLVPNIKTQKLLERIEKDIKDNKNIVGPFATPMEMDTYLDSL